MNYQEIFDSRGRQYHEAMQLMPQARREEFETLFRMQPLTSGETLFDIPSGGGYLADYLDVAVRVQGYEFSRGFASENPKVGLLQMEQAWPIGQADRVVSLAGLHHNADPVSVIARLKTHVKPGGWLHVADVAEGSGVGRFLNGFVDAANPMGHKGIFLPTTSGGYPAGWDIRRIEVCRCPWRFASVAEMARFCKLLFGLRPDCDEALLQALGENVGFTQIGKEIVLQWELLYMDVGCE